MGKWHNLSSGKCTFILWEKCILSSGKKPYPLGSGILSSGKTAFYPRGKGLGYPLVSGTLSSGKWYIILWERKLIPSGKSTMGNWNTTVYINLHIKRDCICRYTYMYIVLLNVTCIYLNMNHQKLIKGSCCRSCLVLSVKLFEP